MSQRIETAAMGKSTDMVAKATLEVRHPDGTTERVPVADFDGCREALREAPEGSWGRVVEWSLMRPLAFLLTLFGLQTRQLRGRALRDITGKEGRVLTRAGEEIKDGGWKMPYSDVIGDVRVGAVKLPPESAAAEVDGEVRRSVGRTPEENRFYLWAVEKLLGKRINFAYCGDDSVMLLTSEYAGWLTPLRKAGVQVLHGTKTGKRARFITSGFPIRGRVDGADWRWAEVHASDFPEVGASEEEFQFRLNGFSAISEKLFEHLLGLSGLSERQKRGFRKHKVFTVRGFLPDGRFVKTVAAVCERPFDGLDLVITGENLKEEVRSESGKLELYLIPYGGKDEARLDIQSLLNLPGVFPERLLVKWGVSDILRVYKGVVKSEHLDSFESLLEIERGVAKDGERTEISESEYLEARHRALYFLQNGRRYEHAPSLARTAFRAHAKLTACDLNSDGLPKTDRVHVPCPTAVYWQILPWVATRLMGIDLPRVTPGQIRMLGEWKLAFVSDEDWEVNNVNCGCGDGDDKFVLVQCESEDEKKVLTWRSPSMPGEYAVYSFVEGDYVREGTVYSARNGGLYSDQVSFPKLDLSRLPKQVSERLAEGSLKIGTLAKSRKSLMPYTKERFLGDLAQKLEGTDPGGFVNALMAFAYASGGHLPAEMPASMERVIDASAQADADGAVGRKIKQFSRLLVEAAAGLGPIDVTLWKSRGLRSFDEDRQPVLERGWVTRVQLSLNEFRLKTEARLEDWLSVKAKNVRPCPEVATVWQQLSAEDKRATQNLLRAFRFAFREQAEAAGGMNAIPEEKKREITNDLHEGLLARNIPASALAFLVLTQPRSDGTLSDGVLFSHDGLFARYMGELDVVEVDDEEPEVKFTEREVF